MHADYVTRLDDHETYLYRHWWDDVPDDELAGLERAWFVAMHYYWFTIGDLD